jgi:predicted nucleic-acid-binding protein
VDFSNIINKTLITYLRVNSNIITEKIAKIISHLLNNTVLGLDRILNKALKTYRLLIAL